MVGSDQRFMLKDIDYMVQNFIIAKTLEAFQYDRGIPMVQYEEDKTNLEGGNKRCTMSICFVVSNTICLSENHSLLVKRRTNNLFVFHYNKIITTQNITKLYPLLCFTF